MRVSQEVISVARGRPFKCPYAGCGLFRAISGDALLAAMLTAGQALAGWGVGGRRSGGRGGYGHGPAPGVQDNTDERGPWVRRGPGRGGPDTESFHDVFQALSRVRKELANRLSAQTRSSRRCNVPCGIRPASSRP